LSLFRHGLAVQAAASRGHSRWSWDHTERPPPVRTSPFDLGIKKGPRNAAPFGFFSSISSLSS
jgi:hypothetical protein